MHKIELNLNDEQLKQLKSQMPGVFKKNKFEVGDEYWYICYDGDVVECEWENDNIDKQRLAYGNAFKTEEEATKVSDRRQAVKRVKDWIEENLGVFEPDWSDANQSKYSIYYNYNNNLLDYTWSRALKQYSPIGYLKSEEDCKRLIENCEEDLLIIYK